MKKKRVMTKKLARLGNSTALVIDKPILELLGIGPNDSVNLRTDGTSLIVTPIWRRPTRTELTEAIEFTLKNYGRALDKLGDASSSSSSREKNSK